jgi:hypothetical protein
MRSKGSVSSYNRKYILDNGIYLFFLIVTISIVNIISSIYFIPIMLVGILFIAFMHFIKDKSYYSLMLIIFTILIVESTQGFRSFSLVAIAFFIYIFIKTDIRNVLSSSESLKSTYVIMFYIFLGLLYGIFNGFDISLVLTIILNMIFDIIIVGLFI